MKAPIVILEATAIVHLLHIARQAVLPKSVDLWYTPLTASQYYNLGLWYWEGAQSKNRPLKALGSARRLAAWQAAGSLAGSWPAAWQAAGWQAGRLAGWQHGCLEVSEKLPIGNQSLKKREEQIGTREDESQWIVAQRPLSHLQYLDSTGSSVQDFPNP